MRFDQLPSVQGVVVDVEALETIAHRCEPALCRRAGTCCAGYDVCVAEDELPKLAGATELAARYVPDLGQGGNVFEELFDGLYSIDTDEDGLCVFAYEDAGGQVLCSLHSAALENGLDVRELKPRCCMLWPLALSGSRPRYLMVDPGAFSYPCNRRKASDGRLDEGIRQIVRCVLGEEFLAELGTALGGDG
jgi:hypothetical protein